MLLLTTEKARAVYFFDQAEIVGQLLFPEFESMLDGFVPSKEWALRTMQAVYVEINHRLLITAAVFFKVGFDDHGWIDGSWNMPLADIAKRSQLGPDLGAGLIRMATFTQCPLELYKQLLWDPEIKGRQNHLGQLKKAVSRNKLGVCFVDDGQAAEADKSDNLVTAMGERLQTVLHQHLNQRDDSGIKNVLAKVIDEQARIPTLVPSTEDLKERLEVLEQALQERDEHLAKLDNQLAQSNTQITQLTEQNVALTNKAEGLRNYYEHKLIRIEQQQLSLATQTQLSTASNAEIAAAVHEATQDFAELLQRKEIELLYRGEREDELLSQLREQGANSAAQEGILEYLQMLVDHGVRFVHYRAGLPPMQIPVGELGEFLASATAYAAQKLGVTEALYTSWLNHYLMPVCAASTPDGPCAASIYRVEEPRHFIIGVSDCCAEHQVKS